jgi:sortase A
VLLLWGALACGAYAAAWQVRKDSAQATLIQAEQQVIRRTAAHQGPDSLCVVSAPQTGQLAGVLRIPALHLVAPVEEGTGDAVLNVSVGHDPSSAWPGATGTSVLLAHDVSYFVHLNQLQPGDQIVYQTACTTVDYTVAAQKVVQAGAPVPNSATPTLVLDTCYPPDALFFTSERLLVEADESRAATGGSPAVVGSGAGETPHDWGFYTVAAPPALVAQGLTLDQNEAPMGTMTLSGQPTPNWEQSPGPLALEAAALEAYFGGIHSAEQLQSAWWTAIAGPGVLPPGPLLGAEITGHDAPLDVEIRSTHGVVTAVVLRTTLTVAGGTAPGTYAETVTLPVHGSTVHVGSWVMTPT